VIPEPVKRPKASYLRFAAEMPNETWQSDFTHYREVTPVRRTPCCAPRSVEAGCCRAIHGRRFAPIHDAARDHAGPSQLQNGAGYSVC
jgi:hypothetical protein